MAKLIKNWDELEEYTRGITTSTGWSFEYDDCSGYLQNNKNIEENSTKFGDNYHYMSTHTFYGMGQHLESTRIFQECGFDIELANWDKDTQDEKEWEDRHFLIPEESRLESKNAKINLATYSIANEMIAPSTGLGGYKLKSKLPKCEHLDGNHCNKRKFNTPNCDKCCFYKKEEQ